MEKDTRTSHISGTSPSSVAQADVVRASLLGTRGFPNGRRYGLNRTSLGLLRTRTHDAVIQACTMPGSTPESIAAAVEQEVERAVFAIGVERID